MLKSRSGYVNSRPKNRREVSVKRKKDGVRLKNGKFELNNKRMSKPANRSDYVNSRSKNRKHRRPLRKANG